mmetsp:Transcript_13794/g.51657  ORF Transcript_13794/g.51657 Transcript_13794/m.51657 type:complete len:206 (+) Transcript_13794:1001-1618(+)
MASNAESLSERETLCCFLSLGFSEFAFCFFFPFSSSPVSPSPEAPLGIGPSPKHTNRAPAASAVAATCAGGITGSQSPASINSFGRRDRSRFKYKAFLSNEPEPARISESTTSSTVASPALICDILAAKAEVVSPHPLKLFLARRSARRLEAASTALSRRAAVSSRVAKPPGAKSVAICNTSLNGTLPKPKYRSVRTFWGAVAPG